MSADILSRNHRYFRVSAVYSYMTKDLPKSLRTRKYLQVICWGERGGAKYKGRTLRSESSQTNVTAKYACRHLCIVFTRAERTPQRSLRPLYFVSRFVTKIIIIPNPAFSGILLHKNICLM